jgi:hypothetical protein
MLAFHVNPESDRGKRIRNDSKLQAALAKWTSRNAGAGAIREPRLDGSTWEIIRCRESSRILADAPDPGAKLVQWMNERAQEWIDDEIIQRITEIAKKA